MMPYVWLDFFAYGLIWYYEGVYIQYKKFSFALKADSPRDKCRSINVIVQCSGNQLRSTKYDRDY